MNKKTFFWILNLTYLAIWIYLAFDVVDRQAWILENCLVVITVFFCIHQYLKGTFSKTSYVLIFVFMLLHAIGAHYTYAKVPIGFTAAEYFGLTRNHYDRVVHFAFGLLWFYPFREILEHRTTIPKKYLSVFTVLIIVAFSSIFELIEWGAAEFTAPELGNAYLGSQGDEWDSQKDHALCSLGGLVSWMWLKAKLKWFSK